MSRATVAYIISSYIKFVERFRLKRKKESGLTVKKHAIYL